VCVPYTLVAPMLICFVLIDYEVVVTIVFTIDVA
jgi:hypothetical protein